MDATIYTKNQWITENYSLKEWEELINYMNKIDHNSNVRQANQLDHVVNANDERTLQLKDQLLNHVRFSIINNELLEKNNDNVIISKKQLKDICCVEQQWHHVTGTYFVFSTTLKNRSDWNKIKINVFRKKLEDDFLNYTKKSFKKEIKEDQKIRNTKDVWLGDYYQQAIKTYFNDKNLDKILKECEFEDLESCKDWLLEWC